MKRKYALSDHIQATLVQLCKQSDAHQDTHLNMHAKSTQMPSDRDQVKEEKASLRRCRHSCAHAFLFLHELKACSRIASSRNALASPAQGIPWLFPRITSSKHALASPDGPVPQQHGAVARHVTHLYSLIAFSLSSAHALASPDSPSINM